jgi:hypothetical protein
MRRSPVRIAPRRSAVRARLAPSQNPRLQLGNHALGSERRDSGNAKKRVPAHPHANVGVRRGVRQETLSDTRKSGQVDRKQRWLRSPMGVRHAQRPSPYSCMRHRLRPCIRLVVAVGANAPSVLETGSAPLRQTVHGLVSPPVPLRVSRGGFWQRPLIPHRARLRAPSDRKLRQQRGRARLVNVSWLEITSAPPVVEPWWSLIEIPRRGEPGPLPRSIDAVCGFCPRVGARPRRCS